MKAIEDLVSLLTRLPGIGRKSALRMTYYLLKADQGYAQALAERISSLQAEIHFCSVCGSYTEVDPCAVCTGLDRDNRMICVVEQPQDVLTIEASREYKGLYHVLGGLLSPLDGIGPDKLRIASLLRRVRESRDEGASADSASENQGSAVEEVVLATNPTVEGDTTALYIRKVLEREGVRVTRLATGIPVGGDLEYADRLTLARSFRGRMPL
ncbi:MAG: recombination mediator RecR [Spirochaetia bacterium]|jgi:recombination protein RecR|uniref:Recombination protein RecR n=1 Tax=bioreactor metagenome TaxID=1076179 RepID=A0A644TM81_9ZZZZ|nr:recombination mediator RecR [Spirochaetia bacterium]MDD3821342.1 recombination mediator RecR [Spirochaetales bacterium]NLX44650.1 recombination protein RecR [Treponema sp.]VBB39075.1 gap repair protein [uncultured Spirochaetota bacterium]HAP55411.1 recombination protein RecR [Spirochaetaceae bacterium]